MHEIVREVALSLKYSDLNAMDGILNDMDVVPGAVF
jgi:hypothetical protein